LVSSLSQPLSPRAQPSAKSVPRISKRSELVEYVRRAGKKYPKAMVFAREQGLQGFVSTRAGKSFFAEYREIFSSG
jgi:hypothetical protein